MIDLHTHTKYSKHAIGEIDDVVNEAILRGIKYLAITDHCPFFIDSSNRLLMSELDNYYKEINRVRKVYQEKIIIFTGMEFDYYPDCEEYLGSLLYNQQLDFILGSIHYIPYHHGFITTWDLEQIDKEDIITSYFSVLKKMVSSGLFNSIAHPDCLLRKIDDKSIRPFWDDLLPIFLEKQVSWEVNTSGFRKTAWDPIKEKYCIEKNSYPSIYAIKKFSQMRGTFTIGSDAHKPTDVGMDVTRSLKIMKRLGIKNVCYYKKRKQFKVEI